MGRGGRMGGQGQYGQRMEDGSTKRITGGQRITCTLAGTRLGALEVWIEELLECPARRRASTPSRAGGEELLRMVHAIWLDNALSHRKHFKGQRSSGRVLSCILSGAGRHACREGGRERERQRRLLGVDARRLAACGLERRRQVVREPPVRAYIPVKLSEVVVELRRRHPPSLALRRTAAA